MTDEQKKKIVLWDKTKPWYQNLIPQGSIPSWVFLLFVLFSVWAYQHDTAAYREVYEAPCDYCNACAYSNDRVPLQPYSERGNNTWSQAYGIVPPTSE